MTVWIGYAGCYEHWKLGKNTLFFQCWVGGWSADPTDLSMGNCYLNVSSHPYYLPKSCGLCPTIVIFALGSVRYFFVSFKLDCEWRQPMRLPILRFCSQCIWALWLGRLAFQSDGRPACLINEVHCVTGLLYNLLVIFWVEGSPEVCLQSAVFRVISALWLGIPCWMCLVSLHSAKPNGAGLTSRVCCALTWWFSGGISWFYVEPFMHCALPSRFFYTIGLQ